jgi:hypothetical protein
MLRWILENSHGARNSWDSSCFCDAAEIRRSLHRKKTQISYVLRASCARLEIIVVGELMPSQRMDATFPSRYEWTLLGEIPNGSFIHYYYPGASVSGGRDGVIVMVKPNDGDPWIGTFAFGQLTLNGLSNVLTTPDPDRLCVIANGDGYLVSAAQPTVWELVHAFPITDARSIVQQGIIVFATQTSLIAYDQSGVKWVTARLAFDDLKITEVGDTFIRGDYFDIRSDTVQSFAVDLATGRSLGRSVI